MPIKVNPPRERLIDRILDENARAAAADQQAVLDYNIMMGNLDDPSEEDTANE